MNVEMLVVNDYGTVIIFTLMLTAQTFSLSRSCDYIIRRL